MKTCPQPLKAMKEKEEGLEILLEIAVSLIRESPERLEVAIDKAIRLFREKVFISHLYAFRHDSKAHRFVAAHASLNSGQGLPPSTFSESELPWSSAQILKSQPVVLYTVVEKGEPERRKDGCFLQQRNIGSLFLFPIMLRKRVWGMLWASSCVATDISPYLTEYLEIFADLLASAIEKNEAMKNVADLLHFDQLLFETSARYINLPVGDIEATIQNDLGRLGRLMGADRCLLYLRNEEDDGFHTCPEKFLWHPSYDAEDVAVSEEFMARYAEFENVFFPYVFERWRRGQSMMFEKPEDLPEEAALFRFASIQFGTKSHLSVPMISNKRTVGALVILANRRQRVFLPDIVQRVRVYGEVFAGALIRKESEEQLQNAFKEIHALKERLESDYIYLKGETEYDFSQSGMIGQGPVMQRILSRISKVACTDTTVLLLGETGTGKGVAARAIHRASRRHDRPLIQVNCAALSPSVIESELFGHERGAYTGAESLRRGRFEIADGATLFLDEIGELPLDLQAKLLRVLESGQFERVGGSRTLHADVRIIAATNRNLEEEVTKGKFRADLWYRLSVFPLKMPPLRERVEDIPLFVHWFVEKYGTRKGHVFNAIPFKNMQMLKAYSWPGNVRELENLVERAVIVAEGSSLVIELPRVTEERQTGPFSKKFRDVERRYLCGVLEDCRWKIEGSRGAAQVLDLNPGTLRSRMKKLGIKRPLHGQKT